MDLEVQLIRGGNEERRKLKKMERDQRTGNFSDKTGVVRITKCEGLGEDKCCGQREGCLNLPYHGLSSSW